MSSRYNPGVTKPLIDLSGDSGTTYSFHIHAADASLPEEPGVFVFTRLLSEHYRDEHYHIIYIGNTDDFSTLLKNELPEQAGALRQATHIFTCTVTDKQQREKIANDLIDFYGKGIPGLN